MLLSWKHGQIWCDDKKPELSEKLLILSGDHGLSHDYLQNLSFVEDLEISPVFFDPLGSGESILTETPSIDLALQEIQHVFNHLIGDNPYHLFGHSSGGWFAMEALARKMLSPPKSLILSNSGCDNRVFLRHAHRLLLKQGLKDYFSLFKGIPNDFYFKAYDKFIQNHIIRTKPLPHGYTESIKNSSRIAYKTLWGDNEIFPTGALKKWKIKSISPFTNLPLLVIHGFYDEVPLKASKELLNKNTAAKSVIFKQSAHCPHLEEPEMYKQHVLAFLSMTCNLR